MMTLQHKQSWEKENIEKEEKEAEENRILEKQRLFWGEEGHI